MDTCIFEWNLLTEEKHEIHSNVRWMIRTGWTNIEFNNQLCAEWLRLFRWKNSLTCIKSRGWFETS